MSEQDLKIGFCPTMSEIAQKIGSKNEGVSLIPLGSAAEALYYVKSATLDAVIIGRIAKRKEISDSVRRLVLQDKGATLVARQKGFIHYRDLPQIPIVTYLDEKTVQALVSDIRNTQFVIDFTEAEAYLSRNNAALIDWSDYNDSLELLIPVDEAGNKIIDFRLPSLYYQAAREEDVKNLELDGLV